VSVRESGCCLAAQGKRYRKPTSGRSAKQGIQKDETVQMKHAAGEVHVQGEEEGKATRRGQARGSRLPSAKQPRCHATWSSTIPQLQLRIRRVLLVGERLTELSMPKVRFQDLARLSARPAPKPARAARLNPGSFRRSSCSSAVAWGVDSVRTTKGRTIPGPGKDCTTSTGWVVLLMTLSSHLPSPLPESQSSGLREIPLRLGY